MVASCCSSSNSSLETDINAYYNQLSSLHICQHKVLIIGRKMWLANVKIINCVNTTCQREMVNIKQNFLSRARLQASTLNSRKNRLVWLFGFMAYQPLLVILCQSLFIHICIYLIYEVHTISFQIFFVWAFKIVVLSWKFLMLLLYIFWDDWPIFMISASNEQLQQLLEYTLLNPDCHSWWISRTR